MNDGDRLFVLTLHIQNQQIQVDMLLACEFLILDCFLNRLCGNRQVHVALRCIGCIYRLHDVGHDAPEDRRDVIESARYLSCLARLLGKVSRSDERHEIAIRVILILRVGCAVMNESFIE